MRRGGVRKGQRWWRSKRVFIQGVRLGKSGETVTRGGNRSGGARFRLGLGRFLVVSSPGWNLGEPIRIFFVSSALTLRLGYKREISEEMPMRMTSSATKRHMFIIQWLNPFVIIMK